MKYIKLIIGGILGISGLIQLLKAIGIYLTVPFDKWPIGSEIGPIATLITGIFVFKSGLAHNKNKQRSANTH